MPDWAWWVLLQAKCGSSQLSRERWHCLITESSHEGTNSISTDFSSWWQLWKWSSGAGGGGYSTLEPSCHTLRSCNFHWSRLLPKDQSGIESWALGRCDPNSGQTEKIWFRFFSLEFATWQPFPIHYLDGPFPSALEHSSLFLFHLRPGYVKAEATERARLPTCCVSDGERSAIGIPPHRCPPDSIVDGL